MELSPALYHRIIRPKWMTNLYIGNIIRDTFGLSEKNILDFGCGTGANCCLFNPSSYLGIDPDGDRIKYAQKAYPNYQFKVMNGQHLDIPSCSADYILIASVLHHIPPYELPCYIREFRRILQPDGAVIVIEPCFSPHSSFNNYFMKICDRGKFIQNPDAYMKIFYDFKYKIYNIKEYKQLILYNKILFAAKPV